MPITIERENRTLILRGLPRFRTDGHPVDSRGDFELKLTYGGETGVGNAITLDNVVIPLIVEALQSVNVKETEDKWVLANLAVAQQYVADMWFRHSDLNGHQIKDGGNWSVEPNVLQKKIFVEHDDDPEVSVPMHLVVYFVQDTLKIKRATIDGELVDGSVDYEMY